MINQITNFFSKLWSNVKYILRNFPTISITNFGKKPQKYIFYTISIFIPILSYILLISELKGFTILLISFSTFLMYLNICVFENLCVIKNKEKCDYDVKDLSEGAIVGLGSLITLFLLKRIYDFCVSLSKK